MTTENLDSIFSLKNDDSVRLGYINRTKSLHLICEGWIHALQVTSIKRTLKSIIFYAGTTIIFRIGVHDFFDRLNLFTQDRRHSIHKQNAIAVKLQQLLNPINSLVEEFTVITSTFSLESSNNIEQKQEPEIDFAKMEVSLKINHQKEKLMWKKFSFDNFTEKETFISVLVYGDGIIHNVVVEVEDNKILDLPDKKVLKYIDDEGVRVPFGIRFECEPTHYILQDSLRNLPKEE